jgi:hypothetical protein
MKMEQDRNRKEYQQIVNLTNLAMNLLVQVFHYFLLYLDQILPIQKISHNISIKIKLFIKIIVMIIAK